MASKAIKSLEKGIDILFLFTVDCPLLTIEEISSRTGMPKSTCYRFLTTLRNKKMIDFDPSSGKCRLGAHILKIESALSNSYNISRLAIPSLATLCSVSEETAQLLVLANDEAVCVETVESPHALRVMPQKGIAIALHSGAAGKTILANLSPAEQERIIGVKQLPSFTANTITDPIALRRQLQEIRERGYAITEGEVCVGVKAVAAPVFDHRRRAVASVCVAGPADRMTNEKTKALIEYVVDGARRISEQLRGEVAELAHAPQPVRQMR